MKRFVLIAILLGLSAQVYGKPDGPAFKVFQFPQNGIPRIDGDFSDWDMVPESYAVGSSELRDDSGKYSAPCPQTLDVKVKVGWVKGLNRLYFYYEAYDNYWDFHRHSLKNDTFELVVDGDLSGGPHVASLRPDKETVSQGVYFFSEQNSHAQNYHVMTPSENWKSWVMIWGPQRWLRDFPWSNCACSYSFREGEAGILKMEFYVTVFDYASPDGPDKSIGSNFFEGKEIGLCWAVIDFDGGESKDGFWNLSKHHDMYGNADHERLFVLQPLENRPAPAVQAAFSVGVEPGTRTARFTDESTGIITSRLWEFGDGATSTERNPEHTYDGTRNQYTATLTVTGPGGESVLCKVRDVFVW